MRYLLIFVWLFILVWVLTDIHPIFDKYHFSTLLLMPLLWWIVYVSVPTFRPDQVVFTPKNIVLFIWFSKLIVIPIELVLLGNQAFQLDTRSSSILLEVSIILGSFIAFWVGWGYGSKSKIPVPVRSVVSPRRWSLYYMGIGLASLVVLYGSLQAYWEGAIFTHVTREALENLGGNWWGLIANIGQRFWAFGVMLAWIWWSKQHPSPPWYAHIPWVLLCLLGTLSSNRANMVFPVVTFLSLVCARWQTQQKWWLLGLVLAGVLFSFFFGYIRTQPALDTQQVNGLLEEYWDKDNNYILYAHQLYFGTPYQITPLLSIEPPVFTLWASFWDSIPLIGKGFREQSGPFLYNMALARPYFSQDKVIPMAGELYFNGGWALVALGHFLFGFVYRFLDDAFKSFIPTDLRLAAAFFYLSLLFSATLLLSLTVLVQLFFYNAAPALLILIGSYGQNFRKRRPS